MKKESKKIIKKFENFYKIKNFKNLYDPKLLKEVTKYRRRPSSIIN